MKYECKSVFAKKLLLALDTTGIGQLISVQEDNQSDILTIDIGPLEIPQYPVVPVENSERVTILAVDAGIPVVYCRDDFPVVPHLNVLEDGHKTLCLFDVSFEDIKYMFNASVFLRRIVYWFEKTARGELHQKDQPLEPFFPGNRDGIIVFSAPKYPFIRLREIAAYNGTLYQEIPISMADGKVYTVLAVKIQKVYTENIIHKMPQTLGELDDAFSEPIVDILHEAIPEIWNVKRGKLYNVLFHQKETELKRSSVLLMVDVSLARTKGVPPEQSTLKVFRVADDYQRLYRSFGYESVQGKLVKKRETLEYKAVPIKPFELIAAFDKNIANHLSGAIDCGENGQYVQIGLGALGSQVANNCIRSGYGRWTYIDQDILYPHNLVRHCLRQDDIGKEKATSMKMYADSLYSERESIVQEAIVSNIFDEDNRGLIESAIRRSDLVVYCTASVAVGRYLSHHLAGSTRAVSFFMNPSGSSLIMLLESANRQSSLDTLEMQYYRLLVHESELHEHLKSEQKVLYSSTCRGTSLVYPQDNASTFSGICSKAIKSITPSTDGAVMVWSFEALTLKLYEETGEVFQVDNCEDWCVKISPTLKKRLHLLRREKLPNETGGVLVGAYDFANGICYIVDAIASPVDSQKYPAAYIRGSVGLMSQVESIEQITVGNLTYIGEWHSHPSDCTEPSPDDRTLLKSIANYMATRNSPACMLIVGESHISIYVEP